MTSALIGCGKKESEQSATVEKPTAVVAKKEASIIQKRSLFNPKKEEVWKYSVTREVPASASLSDADALHITKKHDSHYEMSFERDRVCGGLVSVDGIDSDLILIDIYENGELVEKEYYETNSEGLFGRGWAGGPDQEPVIAQQPIPIAIPAMEGGMMWHTTSDNAAQQFQFRIIGRDTLDLPAGTFDVAQIQIVAGDALNSQKRTLWFAENVGIVKEVSTYYTATSIRIRESSELISWQLPESRQAKQTAEELPEVQPASTGLVNDDSSEDDQL